MARSKGDDASSAIAALVGVVGIVWQAVSAVQRIASGDADKVAVGGHYRKDGRGGRAWVEGRKRSHPL